MATDPRVIGIITCVILVIASPGLAQTKQGKATRYGLAFADRKTTPATPKEIEHAIKVMGERMKLLGVSNVIIEPSRAKGEDIQVFFPPGTDVERAAHLLNTFGVLELKLVAKGTSLPYATKEEAQEAARALEGGLDKYEALPYRPRAEGGIAPLEGWVIVGKIPVITDADMLYVRASKSRYTGGYKIDFQLAPDGAARLGEATGKHIGDYLAIVLNNEVRSAPVITSQITDRAQITGNFTQQSAEDLAVVLNSGSLPRLLLFVSERKVNASR
ncbi:MAG TPA: hypothetical protein VKA70_00570 [Blastocatellia bacterium]|nr:hypothetical protein [Blastocatellia bacterium]